MKWENINRLKRKEKEAKIAETKSRTFRNYCLGVATIASIITHWLGFNPFHFIINRVDKNDKYNQNKN
ncbi:MULTISPECIES: hypothetical protein [Mammaliicoccus]|uniref:hypothetical protein n=1 Tax=Mammaliicoccus TaxID=2803850 RepID=UPI001EFB38AF|nr:MULTISPECIES: hypothetical protein [Mammaliicoccus]